jgi:hypothetical protein
MVLYHFTAMEYLRGIAKFGLTVGDVPTSPQTGRVGVWLTTEGNAGGHGLESSTLDKTRYRLTVRLGEPVPAVHKWSDWAQKHADAEFTRTLYETAGSDGSAWYVCFGVIPPSAIVECTDMRTGQRIEQWAEACPVELSCKGVPAWNRQAWHRKLLKQVARTVAIHNRQALAD